MSTFTLPNNNWVTVSLPSNLTRDQVLAFPAFKKWLSNLKNSLSLQFHNTTHEFHLNPYTLRQIDIQAADFFGTKLGFLKLQALIQNHSGEVLPGGVFLRGASVAMLVILRPSDVDFNAPEEKYVVLTVQPRVPAGSLAFLEIPAGMMDDSETFAGAAAKEIQEELGLTISESELVNLSELAFLTSEDPYGENLPEAIFPSPGGCDESISIFLYERHVPRETLHQWTGKLTGLREDGEKITLKLIKLQDMWKECARDGKALAAWALYSGLEKEGMI